MEIQTGLSRKNNKTINHSLPGPVASDLFTDKKDTRRMLYPQRKSQTKPGAQKILEEKPRN